MVDFFIFNFLNSKPYFFTILGIHYAANGLDDIVQVVKPTKDEIVVQTMQQEQSGQKKQYNKYKNNQK